MRTRICIVTALAVVALVPGLVLAQDTAGIAGAVRDTTEGVLPGVTVEIASPALIEQVRTAVTGGDGQYQFIQLRPGVYSVTFTLPGFGTLVRDNIQLTSGFTANVDAELQLGDVAESITVSGASPVVDVQNVTQQSVLVRSTLETIPSGRSYTGIGKLVPGIDSSGNAGGHDVGGATGRDATKLISHGSATASFKLLVDGMPQMTWIADGSIGVPPSDDRAEEINLQNSALTADMESGGVLFNMIPRTGSNTFSGGFFGNWANSSLQNDNLTQELRDAGLGAGGALDYITDVRLSLGGPIVRDKVWFFATYRDLQPYALSPVFPDSDLTDFAYTPDTSQKVAGDGKPQYSLNSRLTVQASPRNRFGLAYEYANITYNNGWGINRGSFAPEAVGLIKIDQKPITAATWTSTVSNRLLVDVGFQAFRGRWFGGKHPDAVFPGALERTTNITFRAASSNNVIGYNDTPLFHDFLRGAVSYTTGAHSFKVGGSLWHGGITYKSGFEDDFQNYSLRLRNGVPDQVRFMVHPASSESRFVKGSFFAQDQWTADRLTVNIGARVDTQDSGYPDQNLPASAYFGPRSFSQAKVIQWRDWSPRLGIVYDLFGDGRTAIKASSSRYVDWDATNLANRANPSGLSDNDLIRSWNDANGDFIPQGDPANPDPNGEIGPSSDRTWGTPRVSTRYDPDWALGGWGIRGNNWEHSVSVQQELAPNVSVLVGYFYRRFGNFAVDDNLAVGPGDFDTFSITTPLDSQLPTGGGDRLGEFYDVKPAKFGDVDILRTSASNYGDIFQTYKGVDVTIHARLANALLQGGVSTGRELYDYCGVIDELPEMLINRSTKIPADQCGVQQPFLTQVKLIGSYDLPWDVVVAATYQNSYNTTSISPNLNPGQPRLGIAATWLATNAVVAPELGRNLSGRSSASINIVEPGTLFGERLQQLDFRVARTFRTEGGVSIRAMFDLYNALNTNTLVVLSTSYGTDGSRWLAPRGVLPPRLMKLGVSVDF